jgi:hypothetical protein
MGILRKKQQNTLRRTDRRSRSLARPQQEQFARQYAFRRNRTLTGSLSSQVTSVNEQGSELKSSRVHAHHLRKRRKHLGLLLCTVAAGMAILGYLIVQSIASVAVESSTGATVQSAKYEKATQDYLFAHPLERFRFSLNNEQLALYLQEHGSPEVASVSPDLSFAGFGASRLTLTFREPVVAWSTNGSTVYVDGDGVAFDVNYFTTPTVKIIDNTGIQTEGNKVLASNRFLGFIGQVIGKFKKYDYLATEISLPPNTTHQIAVSLKDVPYVIKMSVDRPVGEQAEDAKRAIVYLENQGIAAEYIDVRVSGRAFYK